MNPADQLSVVLAVKDEARQIRECLEQVRFARQVVVVDMGSTDGTAEIARSIADEVLVHDGGPHRLIHVNKNVGFDAARGPWVLSLDADERLTPALRDEILAAIASSPPEVAAYALPFTHYFFGKYLRHGGFRGSLVRLFRKGKLRYPEDRAHSTPAVAGEVRELKGLVVHFNHRSIAEFVRKMNLYTSSDAELLVEHGRGGLRNRPLPRSLIWAMVREPLGVFWNRYVRHAGFLDGAHGLVAAALLAFYQFVERAKVWELRHAAPSCAAASRAAPSGAEGAR
ncbi:MAG: glycosyltransferase family 2 protein [Planctomycetes bacterium]|nr:glycosyltransferase family 2 protein [Planctomycetota bacterium]